MGGMTPDRRRAWLDQTFFAGIAEASRPVKFIYRAPLSATTGSGGTTSEENDRRTRAQIELLYASITGPVYLEFKHNWSHAHSSPDLFHVHGGPLSDACWNPPPTRHNHGLPRWRKHKSILDGLKNQMRVLGNISQKCGQNKPQRLQQAARVYRDQATTLSAKTNAMLAHVGTVALSAVESARLNELTCFHEMLERHLAQYGPGSIKSISFDRGFSSKANKKQFEDVASRVIMPKKGKCNAAEPAAENQPDYIKLSHAHSAVESNINSRDHHGLDRYPDKGFHGYQR